jgi:hypothetical protein
MKSKGNFYYYLSFVLVFFIGSIGNTIVVYALVNSQELPSPTDENDANEASSIDGAGCDLVGDYDCDGKSDPCPSGYMCALAHEDDTKRPHLLLFII